MKFNQFERTKPKCAVRSLDSRPPPFQSRDSASALEHSAKKIRVAERERAIEWDGGRRSNFSEPPEALARVLDQSQLLHLLADLVVSGKGSWRSMENR